MVAVGGPAPRQELGAEIDEHDAVFRFNEAPTLGYEKWVAGPCVITPGVLS